MAKAFNISIWKRNIEQNKVSLEKNRKKTLNDLSSAVDQLSLTYKWDALYFFGSITKPDRFGEYSDIDIGIQGLDKYFHYRFIADLSAIMDREVDVVRLEDCSFADTIRNRGVQWKKKD